MITLTHSARKIGTGSTVRAGAAEEAVRFARAMLRPGKAAILDTETVSLHDLACEVAVIDACTGKTLLDMLVNLAL